MVQSTALRKNITRAKSGKKRLRLYAPHNLYLREYDGVCVRFLRVLAHLKPCDI